MTISTIGTTGRDYSTCKAWADAAAATLSAPWEGQCYNDGTITDSAGLSLDSTADATNYMLLTTATGQSFADHASKLTNALRPNQANGVLIDLSTAATGFVITNFNIVEKLQITHAGSGNVATMFGSGSGSTMSDFGMIRRCLIKQSHATGGATDGLLQNNRCHIVNVAMIVAGNSNAIKSGAGVQGRVSSVTLLCTNGSSTREGINTTADVFDCAVFGFGANNTVGGSSSNGATDRASFGGGSSNQTSLTTTNEIESATSGSEDLRAKSTSTLKNNGVRDQTYTNDLDIVGQSRSTSTPTIGCWEVVAGGGGAVQSLMQISG